MRASHAQTFRRVAFGAHSRRSGGDRGRRHLCPCRRRRRRRDQRLLQVTLRKGSAIRQAYFIWNGSNWALASNPTAPMNNLICNLNGSLTTAAAQRSSTRTSGQVMVVLRSQLRFVHARRGVGAERNARPLEARRVASPGSVVDSRRGRAASDIGGARPGTGCATATGRTRRSS